MIRYFILLAVLVGSGTVVAAEPQPLNVLFIAVDDLRPELGCYGNNQIKSPNIDALAEQSVVFTRAYCQQAVCNPSRASLLTGLRPDATKVWDLVTHFRDTIPDVVTLPQHFRKHGYQAIAYGKIFHNPLPDADSWDEPNHWPKKARNWSSDSLKRLKAFREQMRKAGKTKAAVARTRAPAIEDEDVPDSARPDGEITDQAIASMRRLASDERPFFLAVGFVKPHLPFNAPKRYWNLYDPDQLALAENALPPKYAPPMAMNTMYELRDYMDFVDTSPPDRGALNEEQQRRLKHGYYAAVSFADAQVGRLLAELDRLELRENTIVVLWGDHGWKLGEHRSWCKQTNFEIDTRAPLIIQAPGDNAANGKSNAIVEFVDVYPTLCELAKLPLPTHLQGRSLEPLMRKPDLAWPHAAFSQFRRRSKTGEVMGYAMRTERFRFVEWLDRSSCETVVFELYDHKRDPQENTNIAVDPTQQARIEELSAKMWKAIDRPKPGMLDKSLPARPTLRFKNIGNKTTEVFWIAPNGRRVSQGRVAPGKVLNIKSKLTHRFQVGDDRGKNITVSKQDETIAIEQPKPDESGAVTKRPNILVLMGDDWSWPHAGYLGDKVVQTPTFDRLARNGIVFEHAFVSSPSCTPSRMSIATGQWHWRLAEAANLGGSLATDVPVYPDLLKAEGYAVGFSRKGASPSKHTHRGNDPFGARFASFESFLKKCEPSQPFCFWYGAGEPHRPYRFGVGKRQGLKPEDVKVPECLPDDKTLRNDMCDYYEAIGRFDRDAGQMLKRLEAIGELENTLVIVSGDNGMPFPRCKATLYDMGTRVPLIIHWPRVTNGKRQVQDFVSLTDLAPTILQAAGVEVPETMTGKSLLPILASKKSGQVDKRRSFVLTGVEQHVYSHPSRAIRTKDYLYIRNFGPERWPTGESKQQTPVIDFTDGSWPSFPGAFSFNIDPSPTKQFLLDNRGDSKVKRFFELACGKRPREELYDIRKDPGQIKNLANSDEHLKVKNELSRRLMTELRKTNDPRAKVYLNQPRINEPSEPQ